MLSHWTSTSLLGQQRSVASHTACITKQVQGQVSKYFTTNNKSGMFELKKDIHYVDVAPARNK
jgi:hypothetical protein